MEQFPIRLPQDGDYFRTSVEFLDNVIYSATNISTKIDGREVKVGTTHTFDLLLIICDYAQYMYNKATNDGAEGLTECSFTMTDSQLNTLLKLDPVTQKTKMINSKKLTTLKEQYIENFVKGVWCEQREEMEDGRYVIKNMPMFYYEIAYVSKTDKTPLTYTITLTPYGISFLNKMFGYTQGNSYSYYLVCLGMKLQAVSGKALLGVLCQYHNAIMRGKFNNGQPVRIDFKRLYTICGLNDKNPSQNFNRLQEQLDKINKELQILGFTDKQGYPIKFTMTKVKDEKRKVLTDNLNAIRTIEFGYERIEGAKRIEPNSTLKLLYNHKEETIEVAAKQPKKTKSKAPTKRPRLSEYK